MAAKIIQLFTNCPIIDGRDKIIFDTIEQRENFFAQFKYAEFATTEQWREDGGVIVAEAANAGIYNVNYARVKIDGAADWLYFFVDRVTLADTERAADGSGLGLAVLEIRRDYWQAFNMLVPADGGGMYRGNIYVRGGTLKAWSNAEETAKKASPDTQILKKPLLLPIQKIAKATPKNTWRAYTPSDNTFFRVIVLAVAAAEYDPKKPLTRAFSGALCSRPLPAAVAFSVRNSFAAAISLYSREKTADGYAEAGGDFSKIGNVSVQNLYVVPADFFDDVSTQGAREYLIKNVNSDSVSESGYVGDEILYFVRESAGKAITPFLNSALPWNTAAPALMVAGADTQTRTPADFVYIGTPFHLVRAEAVEQTVLYTEADGTTTQDPKSHAVKIVTRAAIDTISIEMRIFGGQVVDITNDFAVAIPIDNAAAYMQRNKESLQLSQISSAVAIAGGAIAGNVMTFAGGVINAAQQNAARNEARSAPPSISSTGYGDMSIRAGSLLFIVIPPENGEQIARAVLREGFQTSANNASTNGATWFDLARAAETDAAQVYCIEGAQIWGDVEANAARAIAQDLADGIILWQGDGEKFSARAYDDPADGLNV